MKKKIFTSVLAMMLTASCLTGCVGTQGAQGSFDEPIWNMQTAYAKAQELGYEGTLEEFIASISGKDGQDGEDGQDGVTPTIEISEDGYWVINGEKTSTKAVGADGADGADGKTPTIEISEDGYWVINGEKTETKAKGEDGAQGDKGDKGDQGEPGVGISSMYIKDGHLFATLTNGTTIDCGEIPTVEDSSSAKPDDSTTETTIVSEKVADKAAWETAMNVNGVKNYIAEYVSISVEEGGKDEFKIISTEKEVMSYYSWFQFDLSEDIRSTSYMVERDGKYYATGYLYDTGYERFGDWGLIDEEYIEYALENQNPYNDYHFTEITCIQDLAWMESEFFAMFLQLSAFLDYEDFTYDETEKVYVQKLTKFSGVPADGAVKVWFEKGKLKKIDFDLTCSFGEAYFDILIGGATVDMMPTIFPALPTA